MKTLLLANQTLRLPDERFEKLTSASWHRTATRVTVRFEFARRQHELTFDTVPTKLLETLREHGVSVTEVNPIP